VQPGLFERVVRDAFSQRRKTLRNALKHYQAEPVFTRLGIDPQLRAERLSIEQFAELAAALEG
jgi:16S rRNA (adenine1518-N6/adenine1519-N6)-dimethyltransferase